MVVTTYARYEWNDRDQLYELVDQVGYDYDGPVALACWGSGSNAASQAEIQAKKQQQLYDEMSNEMQQQYSRQSAIFQQLTQAFSPIVGAGIDQYGFSPGEQSALSTQAIEGAAGSAAKAEEAAKAQNAALNPGGLPSGAQAQLNADISQQANQAAADAQLGIKRAGYAQGRENFMNASRVLGGVAEGENPAAYGKMANDANTGALDAIKEEQALNPNIWGGVLGALAPMADLIPGVGPFIGAGLGLASSAMGGNSYMPPQWTGSGSGGGGGDNSNSNSGLLNEDLFPGGSLDTLVPGNGGY